MACAHYIMNYNEGRKGVSTYSVLAFFFLFVRCSWEKLFHVHCSHCIPHTLFLEIIILRTVLPKKNYITPFSLSPYLAFSSYIYHTQNYITYDKNNDYGPLPA